MIIGLVPEMCGVLVSKNLTLRLGPYLPGRLLKLSPKRTPPPKKKKKKKIANGYLVIKLFDAIRGNRFTVVSDTY